MTLENTNDFVPDAKKPRGEKHHEMVQKTLNDVRKTSISQVTEQKMKWALFNAFFDLYRLRRDKSNPNKWYGLVKVWGAGFERFMRLELWQEDITAIETRIDRTFADREDFRDNPLSIQVKRFVKRTWKGITQVNEVGAITVVEPIPDMPKPEHNYRAELNGETITLKRVEYRPMSRLDRWQGIGEFDGKQVLFWLFAEHAQKFVDAGHAAPSKDDKDIPNIEVVLKWHADRNDLRLDGVFASDGTLHRMDDPKPVQKPVESPTDESDEDIAAQVALDMLEQDVNDTFKQTQPVAAPPASNPEPPIPTKPVEWAKWVLENRNDVVILDLETTDKQDKKNPNKKIEIVQIAVIDMDGNPLVNTLIKPIFVDINPEAARIHGKTLDILVAAGATSFADNWSTIKAAIENKHIIIYNRDFDKSVLEGCVKLHGLEIPQVKGWHCAMLHYVAHNDWKGNSFKDRGAWWRLTEALEQERIPPDEFAHDALVDVQMTRQLVEKMATNDPNKWRNQLGFDTDEIVIVKDSGTQMQVVKTLDSGELLLKGMDEPTVSLTLRASAVDRFNGDSALAEETPEAPEPEPIAETPSIEDKHAADTEPVTVDEPNTPDKVADPYQAVKDKFRAYKLELLHELAELLQEIIDEKEAEAEEAEPVTQ